MMMSEEKKKNDGLNHQLTLTFLPSFFSFLVVVQYFIGIEGPLHLLCDKQPPWLKEDEIGPVYIYSRIIYRRRRRRPRLRMAKLRSVIGSCSLAAVRVITFYATVHVSCHPITPPQN